MRWRMRGSRDWIRREESCSTASGRSKERRREERKEKGGIRGFLLMGCLLENALSSRE